MNLNTFLLFDGELMFEVLPIFIILKGKKNNVNCILYRAKNNAFRKTKYCAGQLRSRGN